MTTVCGNSPDLVMPGADLVSELIAHVDGASRGNPGPAAYAVILRRQDNTPLTILARRIGRATNNVAEYHGLVAVLRYAIEHGCRRLKVFTDSELMARQVNGAYKVRSDDLKPLYDEAQQLIRQLAKFSIVHVPREQNRQADRLANQKLDDVEKLDDDDVEERAQPNLELRARGSEDAALRAPAVYRDGAFVVQKGLPFTEGEEVTLEIRRTRRWARFVACSDFRGLP